MRVLRKYRRIQTSTWAASSAQSPISPPVAAHLCANRKIVACGMVSQYNITDPDQKYGVKNLGVFVVKRLTMRGFVFTDADMGPKYTVDHQKNVAKWISEGSFKAQQSVTAGIDNAVKGFLGMLKGENFGKAVLQIEEMKMNNA